MAKRRLLAIDFCESDSFYCLSPTARMLYVHFILNADDDGFVDKWRSVLRCARIETRHYKTLRDEGYVIELSERLIVITDWHRHNTIRADRYVATAYAKELRGLRLDENKRYFKASEDLLVNQCVPQNRIDKIREDKSSIEYKREEEGKENIFTTNISSIHSNTASQEKHTNDISVFEGDSPMFQSLKNNIRLYFMKNYQTTNTFGFIEHYEAKRWIAEDGGFIFDNYKRYIDEWMAKQKGAPFGTPL